MTETPLELFIPETFHIQVQVEQPMPVREIELGIIRNTQQVEGMKTAKAVLVPGSKTIYQTPPIQLEQKRERSPKSDARAKSLEVNSGDVLTAIPAVPLFLEPPSATITTYISPNNKSSLWKSALFRAARLNSKKIGDWDRATTRQEADSITKIIVGPEHLFPGRRRSIDTEKVLQKVQFTLGEHAAMLLLKQTFIEMAEERLTELKRVQNDRTLMRGWYRTMKPIILRGRKLDRDEFPLAFRPITIRNYDWSVPLWHAFDDHKLRKREKEYIHRNNAQPHLPHCKLEVWIEEMTRAGIGHEIRYIESAIQHAKSIDDSNIKDLLYFTGYKFDPVLSRVVTRLMKLKNEGSAGNPRKRWVPDYHARLVVRQISSVFAQLHALEEASDRSQDAVLAFLSIAAFNPGSLLLRTIVVVAATGAAVEVERLYELHSRVKPNVRFSAAAIGILGHDRLREAMVDDQDYLLPVATTVMCLVGLKWDLTEVARLTKLSDANKAAGRLLTTLDSKGMDGLRVMSKSDIRKLSILLEDARFAQQAGRALSDVQKRSLAAIKQLERSSALLSDTARFTEPFFDDSTRNIGLHRFDHNSGSWDPPIPGTRRPPPGMPEANSLFHTPDGELIRMGRHLGSGAYASVYEVVDNAGEPTGKVIKLIRQASFDTTSAGNVVRRMKAGSELIEQHDDILKLRCHRFETRGKYPFVVQDALPASTSYRILSKGCHTGRHSRRTATRGPAVVQAVSQQERRLVRWSPQQHILPPSQRSVGSRNS